MNLNDVIEALVEERGLEREMIISAVCEGVLASYSKKYPESSLSVVFNKKLGAAEIFIKKTVVSSVKDELHEVSLKKARVIKPNAKIGEEVEIPFEDKIGRVEILIAKQVIANKIRSIEQAAIFNEFKDKEGLIISGNVHKRERAGFVVKIGDVMALLPTSLSIPGENIRIGVPIRALLSQVLPEPKGDFQLILDRGSSDFVKKLLELEIPEVFEGLVEIKKVVRISGYKTKVAVVGISKEIDPVGTCIGVDGVRIKPILREIGGEKIDVIEWSDSLEVLIKNSLKPAEIDKVEIVNNKKAIVWLAEDQRSRAIGKMGRNILLASKLTGVEINLQEPSSEGKGKVFDNDDEVNSENSKD